MQILSQYEEEWGQAINHQKTSLFFSKNTKPQVRGMIQQMLDARIMTQCDRYLGLPMAIGNSKVKHHQGPPGENYKACDGVEREVYLQGRL